MAAPPFHVTDDFAWNLEHFVIPEHYAPDLASVMISHGLIQDRIDRLANDICKAYDFHGSGARLHMLCVLKGGHQFFSDLCNALKKLTLVGVKEPPLTFDFIRVKSYHNTESSGDITIETVGIDLPSLKGRNILLVEDIIDTGATMSKLVPYLQSYEPTSVRVATLLKKRTPKSNGFEADFTGFSIPDKAPAMPVIPSLDRPASFITASTMGLASWYCSAEFITCSGKVAPATPALALPVTVPCVAL
jgi:hypoxanthine phosphoribosyltransferase